MQQPSFDPGLTQQYTGPLRRAINPDGTFNVNRKGTNWRDIHPYLHLVSMSWPRFFSLIILAYVAVNFLFAIVYFSLGPHALISALPASTLADRFLENFFFSSQTLTTVGFGTISPRTHMASAVAAFEAFLGLLGFAVATGVLLGRISRPSARIGFSEKAMMARYQDGYGFQFRVVNRRSNALAELQATLLMMNVERSHGEVKRRFTQLKLERDRVMFFPLTWTVVHPVDADSPLFGKTEQEMISMEVEFLIQVSAWDETFSQTVRQRYSYRPDEIVWDGKFVPAFTVVDDGSLALEVNKVGAFMPLAGPVSPQDKNTPEIESKEGLGTIQSQSKQQKFND